MFPLAPLVGVAGGLMGAALGDLTRARHLRSPQLTGTRDATMTDLNSVSAQGIRIVGRLGRITGGVAQFSGSLANT